MIVSSSQNGAGSAPRLQFVRRAGAKDAIGARLEVGIDVVDLGDDVGIIAEAPHDRHTIAFAVAHDESE